MKKRICMFAAFMLALSLVLCGCGGFSDVGDGTSATGEAPTSRAEESSGAAVPDTTGDTSVAADTTTVETPPETPPETTEEWVSEYDGRFGSAGKLAGNTVIVSIYTTDAGTSWGAEDAEQIDETLRYLGIAAAWLSRNAYDYGTQADFIYDWSADPELRLDAMFDVSLVRQESDFYDLQADYVRENVDSEGLCRKYRADNIIYFFFFNTGFENTVRPWTVGGTFGGNLYVEYTNLYVKFNDVTSPPSTYAHEVLHTYGAPDLYYASPAIPQEYVDMCAANGSNDIMYTVYLGDEITNELSPLIAYYVGIAPRPLMADTWGFPHSAHEGDGEIVYG